MWHSLVVAKNRFLDSHVVVLCSAYVFFALGNMFWRVGSGSMLAVAAQRSVFGIVFLLPLLRGKASVAQFASALRDTYGLLAILFSGLTLITSSILFRSVTGPQVALVIAIMPALVILPSRVISGSRVGKAMPALLISVVAALLAVLSGGTGAWTLAGAAASLGFLAIEICSVVTAERARKRIDTLTIVAGGMALGAVVSLVYLLIVRPDNTFSMSNLIAALMVAVVGTTGRLFKNYALPFVGGAVTAGAGQITALITAVGGIVFFGDHIRVIGILLGVLSATAAVIAVIQTCPNGPKESDDIT